MCQQHPGEVEPPAGSEPSGHDGPGASEPFPWDVGVYDAHCHPTNTMTSIASIPGMKARALTVMSSRAQDQDLVAEVASEHGSSSQAEVYLVPGFGWHPWFSYQFYDDLSASPTYDGTPSGKISHYDKVLAPSPSSKDVSFSEGLPEPRPLSEFVRETKSRLERYPLALVGEIGLDKAFRLPQSWTSAHEAQRDAGLTPGGREGRRLSPYRVQVAHQVAILQAQLRLAGEMGRAVSVHGVQAHGVVYDTIAKLWKGYERPVTSRRKRKQIAEGAEDFSSSSSDEDDDYTTFTNRGKENKAKPGRTKQGPKPYPPRICMHSFSGPVDVVRQYLHPSVPVKVFFSFSIVVNWSTGGGGKAEEAIRAVPDDRILVESDLHTAGEQMDRYLEEVCRKICKIKGWELREGVEKLGRNWKEFIFG
ncbi:Cut9-interacting protein scn1 [Daldinia caldariorum]|uniref:Cut9-interacting protein scn1 n=1 Tax=Daldinia caldariorum TaxID=326644 RepID=UPI002008761F|nr:Cut9-interacting protein scn1 [Daldinia caldariorum]KAI1465885.1 Cut9-interacting protein scn1 [Daldinia caldariorum]